jgi:hypothetical protein
MVAPGAQALLNAWEASRGGEAARVVALLRLAGAPVAPGAELDVPLGRRNLALLGLHEHLVGPSVEAVVRCPTCAVLNELSVPVSALRLSPGEQLEGGYEGHIGDTCVRYRLLTTRDAIDAAAEGDAPAGAALLARRCLLAADGPVAPEEAGALAALLAEADPPSEFAFHLACVGCGGAIDCVLDPVHLLAAEVDRAARSLLDDVHTLALAYHWSEADILALSQRRRRAYLDRLDA